MYFMVEPDLVPYAPILKYVKMIDIPIKHPQCMNFVDTQRFIN